MSVKIFTVVKKNLQIIFNSKLYSLIFILGPIILILISSAVLQDTSLRNIKAGVFIPESTTLSDNILNDLRSRSFRVKLENSLYDCKQNVIDAETHVCISLEKVNDPSLERYLQEKFYYETVLYVDFSKQRVVWSIIGAVRAVIDQKNNEIRSLMVSDLNSQIDSLIQDIESKEVMLDSSINEIDSVIDTVDDLSGIEFEIASDLNSVEYSIISAQESLNSLKVVHGPFSSSYFVMIEDSLNSARARLRDAQETLISSNLHDHLEDTESYLRDIKEDLISTKDSIKEVKDGLIQIKNLDINRILNPLPLVYQPVSGGQAGGSIEGKLGFLDYLFPSFLMFFLLFVSLLLSTTLIIRERSSNAYVRNITSKTSGLNFILGNFITCLFLLTLQLIVILVIAKFFLNLDLISNLVSLILVLFISVFIFALIGVALGYIFDSQEASIIAAICFALLFFMLSPLVTPIEMIPNSFSKLVSYSPMVILETKIRMALIFNNIASFSFGEILSLVGLLAITVLCIVFFYRRKKDKEI
jgi:ABC-type multidrug transport system permease subunit